MRFNPIPSKRGFHSSNAVSAFMKKHVPNFFPRRTCVHSFRKIGLWHLGSVTC